jgi:pimeloyl-ACP methyl ester carboxylesterase
MTARLDPSPRALAVPGGMVQYIDHGGAGEPVLLVHAGVFGAWFAPLAAEPALREFRVVRLLRAGYTGGPPPTAPLSVAQHAGHCAAVLEDLDLPAAHVVAHSSGSVIALQLALDRPELVGRLVLVEPPLIDQLAAPDDLPLLHELLGPVIGAAIAAAAAGDVATAFHSFMDVVCGPEHRAVLDATLGPDAMRRAYHDAEYFFADEVRALAEWQFGPEDAARVDHPTLLVHGGASAPAVRHVVERLAAALRRADVATVDGEDHLLPLRSPERLARIVADHAHDRVAPLRSG